MWYGTLPFSHEGKWDSTYSHSNGGTIQRYQSSSIQEYQRFESWNPEKEKLAEIPYTSMRMLQTPSSCSELFNLLISSVSTEQFRIGVNNSA